jgi:hypothetical protein
MKIKINFFLILFLLFINIQASENICLNKIKYSDGRSIYYFQGAKVICSPDADVKIYKNIIKLTKGKLWVTAAGSTLLKIIYKKIQIEVNRATVDINSEKNTLFIFNGFVYMNGNRVNKGQNINLKNFKINKTENPDTWQEENIKAEITSVSLETQAKDEIKDKFNKKIYEILTDNYLTSGKDENEFLIKLTISEKDNTVKGTINNIINEKIIGIIDEKLNDGNYQSFPVEYAAVKTGNNLISIINSFMEGELYKGRTIAIETSQLNDTDLNVLKNILLNISGLKIIEEKSYYKIKHIIRVNYIGNGYDIAEIIKDKSNKFKIWYISKSNIKIKVQN